MNYYLEAFKKYAVFSGRATRSEYWFFVLFNMIAFTFFNVLDFFMLTGGFFNGIYTLFIFIPALALGARRLHDIGKSGWWQLLGIIPLIGFIVLIIWFATDSTDDNKYGKSSKSKTFIADSVVADLEKLAELKENGIITEEEFVQQKKILLNSCDENQEDEKGSYWLAISSMILSFFAISFTENYLVDEAKIFIMLSLLFGGITIFTHKKGKDMAIAGMILSVLAIFMIVNYTQW